MDVATVLESLDLYHHLTAVLLGTPRFFALALTAPFLGSAVVTGQVRLLLVLALYLPLHPVVVNSLQPAFTLSPAMTLQTGGLLVAMLLKETLIGLVLGFLAGMAFWAVQSAGMFIDHQRGASTAEGTDILSGEQSSPLGQLLFQSLTCLFYATGAFLIFLNVIYATFHIWPITSPLPHVPGQGVPLYFAIQVDWLFLHMLLLAGPISAACLLTDVSLGLMNRFASQLNVYVLSMPIKCGLASFLLCVYLGLLLHYGTNMFAHVNRLILTLPNLLQP